jgi:phage regulator Rha-like protein
MFQLTIEEARSTERSRSQIATLKRGKNLKYRPLAFTEHGAIMAANVLNSKRAVRVSVQIVRAFIRLRQILASNEELARNLTTWKRNTTINSRSSSTRFESHDCAAVWDQANWLST